MAEQPPNSDRAFVEAIEACTLPSVEFTHRNHVRLAWLYLQEADADAHPELLRRDLLSSTR